MMKLTKHLRYKWANALRSGAYIQARHDLCNTQTGGLCCLGVLASEVKLNKEQLKHITSNKAYTPLLLNLRIEGYFSNLNDTHRLTFNEIADKLTVKWSNTKKELNKKLNPNEIIL